jgi:hypothetical protein
MHIHALPPWIPIATPPVKKAEKPRKFFHTEEARESSSAATQPPRPSDILDEEFQGQQTNILA